MPQDDYSDYIVYVDESGDHGLKNIDENYPVFVLAFCIFSKQDYIEQIVPKLQSFKFQHFGHDQAILHETDIRRDRGEFSFLKTREAKNSFLSELTAIIEQSPFTLVSTVIKKIPYRQRYHEPANPYHVALGYGLERVFYCLRDCQAHLQKAHIVVEKRGKQEDRELELEFRRICDGGNYECAQLPFELVFADKKSNSAGLQFADLIARPVGLHVFKPEQVNRAFEVIETKFYGGNWHNGRGLKCFP
ncbi:MAG: DUF3800 domain-containing protein [Bacteroidota bacterium]